MNGDLLNAISNTSNSDQQEYEEIINKFVEIGESYPVTADELKYLLYGEKDMPEKGYLNDPWPMPSLRQRRKRKGTVVCCFVCGDSHTMLYKDDNGYICRTCRRKRS